MLVICSIVVAVNMGGVYWLSEADTKGKIISESSTKYLVDFTDGVKTYKIDDPKDYSQVLVDKHKCVKVK